MPFFSIIIPTQNSEKDIEKCIFSILGQTYKEFEVIILDSISSDNTVEILSQVKRSHLTIPFHIYSEKDSGIYDAMNKGINIAKGKWILFLGSDDELYDEFVLEKVFKECSGSDVDVIYGNVLNNDLNSIYDGKFTNEKLLRQNICHQAIFYKVTVFNKIGYFNLRYKVHADWEHNMRWFFSNSISKKYVEVIVSRYGGGGFSSRNRDKIFEREKVLKYLILSRSKLKPVDKVKIIRSLLGYAVLTKDMGLIGKVIFQSPGILLNVG